MFEDDLSGDTTTATTATEGGFTEYTSDFPGTSRITSATSTGLDDETALSTGVSTSAIGTDLTSFDEDQSRHSKARKSSRKSKGRRSTTASMDSSGISEQEVDQSGQEKSSVRQHIKNKHLRAGALVASEHDVNAEVADHTEENEHKRRYSKNNHRRESIRYSKNNHRRESITSSGEKRSGRLSQEEIVDSERRKSKQHKSKRKPVDSSGAVAEDGVDSSEKQELNAVVENAINQVENLLVSKLSQKRKSSKASVRSKQDIEQGEQALSDVELRTSKKRSSKLGSKADLMQEVNVATATEEDEGTSKKKKKSRSRGSSITSEAGIIHEQKAPEATTDQEEEQGSKGSSDIESEKKKNRRSKRKSHSSVAGSDNADNEARDIETATKQDATADATSEDQAAQGSLDEEAQDKKKKRKSKKRKSTVGETEEQSAVDVAVFPSTTEEEVSGKSKKNRRKSKNRDADSASVNEATSQADNQFPSSSEITRRTTFPEMKPISLSNASVREKSMSLHDKVLTSSEKLTLSQLQ